MKCYITKENLKKILLDIENIKDIHYTHITKYRYSGYLEGILYSLGKIKPKDKFNYKEIEYIEIGWFGQKIIKKRKQTYLEYLIEKTKELINES